MQTAFILATLAGSAVANILNAAPILKRDLESLQARQTDGGLVDSASKCQSAALGLLTTLPTPPPKIQSDILKNPQTGGDPCSFSTPASLSADYSSYSSQLLSWYSEHSKDVDSVMTACSDLAQLGGDMINFCSTELPKELQSGASAAATDATKTQAQQTGAAASGSAASGSAAAAATSAGASQAKASSTSTGGAPRATGMAVAGLAAAGLVAAVL